MSAHDEILWKLQDIDENPDVEVTDFEAKMLETMLRGNNLKYANEKQLKICEDMIEKYT